MTKTDAMIEQIRALLDDPAQADDDRVPPTASQIRTIETDFYVRQQGVFSVNTGTLGIEMMHDVAGSLIARKGNPPESLSGAIVILPLPTRQCESRYPPPHRQVAPGEKQPAASPKSRSRKFAKKKPKALSKAKRPVFPTVHADPSPIDTTQYFYFELAGRTQEQVREDLEKMYRI
ncbi:hypothetical protein PC129_g23938 [Phytophthora cactorum]|uniref:Uncharacterized protein n=1 Tax=Phytophthora cactorum TaxID=29920 RepID=A0A329RCT1_9STRA|nr:hypothetical protein Pcac1_g28289 [Phytophthora cactorum]KAG2770403.1 hypothetical protein Pcac1_g18599 [Phytophthora cactorum]KAG2793511.1 hypothetical protein PC111_g23009 [Phytophthora cactorum]KAG2793672.1 hypothetical protein PC112_g23345 [Phytophthora cactorum]KAG2816083.1 hypothetical protein PC113_g23137 [Phytophthora cactorum]